MKAGLYARISNAELQEGYSIEAQLDALRAHALAQGWVVSGEYVDPGYSGKDGDRPAFQRLMGDARAGCLEVIAVHKLDRFYRNLRGQLDALGRLETWGVAFVSVVEAIDYSTPWGKLVQNQLGAFNQFYLDNLRQETVKGKRARAKSGRTNASVTAYGYRRQKQGERLGDPEPEPETSSAVVLAFESYATGLYDDQGIANLLNSRGYKPSGRARSGRFTREGVRYMLSNAFYVGQVRHGDDLYPGNHEPLISQELWDQVQAIRRRRGAGKGAGRKPHRVYLLARLARCSNCGLRLTAKTSGGNGRRGTTRYYFCPAHRRSVDCPDARGHVLAAAVEGQVADLVMRLQLPEDWRERLEELANYREERDAVETKRQYFQRKLRRLRDLYLEGDYTKAEYDRERADLQSQLAGLQTPDRPDVEQAGETLESLGMEWAHAPEQYQRDMLQVIFEAIYVDVAARRVVCVKPYPQFVPLFRMDGLEEREDGCFYRREGEEAGSED